MTQLTPTLYAVVKPDHVSKVYIDISNTLVFEPRVLKLENIEIDLPDGNWELLGTVTPDAIDFDCSFMAVKCELMVASILHAKQCYDSRFRSLLTSKGCDLTKKHVIIKSKI